MLCSPRTGPLAIVDCSDTSLSTFSCDIICLTVYCNCATFNDSKTWLKPTCLLLHRFSLLLRFQHEIGGGLLSFNCVTFFPFLEIFVSPGWKQNNWASLIDYSFHLYRMIMTIKHRYNGITSKNVSLDCELWVNFQRFK